MAQAGDGGVDAAGGQANGDAAQPIIPNAAAAVNGVAVMVAPAPNLVAPAPLAAPAGAAAPVAAMLALLVAPNLAVPPIGVQPGFDIDFVLLGPLPTKTNFKGYETYPRVEEP